MVDIRSRATAQLPRWGPLGGDALLYAVSAALRRGDRALLGHRPLPRLGGDGRRAVPGRRRRRHGPRPAPPGEGGRRRGARGPTRRTGHQIGARRLPAPHRHPRPARPRGEPAGRRQRRPARAARGPGHRAGRGPRRPRPGPLPRRRRARSGGLCRPRRAHLRVVLPVPAAHGGLRVTGQRPAPDRAERRPRPLQRGDPAGGGGGAPALSGAAGGEAPHPAVPGHPAHGRPAAGHRR